MRATAALASLQHVVVVGVDRDVGVHVAVAGVHVQRHEHAALQHLRVDRPRSAASIGAKARPLEHAAQRLRSSALPRDAAERASLQRVEERRIVDARRGRSAASGRGVCPTSSSARATAIAEVSPPLSTLSPRRRPAGSVAAQEFGQRIEQLQLVADRQLDVDALDAVGVVAQARQRDHHVLVDLEGVGVPGDGGGARAVEPEFLARLGEYRDEALAAARVGDAHDLEAASPTAASSSLTMSASSTMLAAARGASPWWHSPPPSGSARPGVPGRPASACGMRVEVVA